MNHIIFIFICVMILAFLATLLLSEYQPLIEFGGISKYIDTFPVDAAVTSFDTYGINVNKTMKYCFNRWDPTDIIIIIDYLNFIQDPNNGFDLHADPHENIDERIYDNISKLDKSIKEHNKNHDDIFKSITYVIVSKRKSSDPSLSQDFKSTISKCLENKLRVLIVNAIIPESITFKKSELDDKLFMFIANILGNRCFYKNKSQMENTYMFMMTRDKSMFSKREIFDLKYIGIDFVLFKSAECDDWIYNVVINSFAAEQSKPFSDSDIKELTDYVEVNNKEVKTLSKIKLVIKPQATMRITYEQFREFFNKMQQFHISTYFDYNIPRHFRSICSDYDMSLNNSFNEYSDKTIRNSITSLKYPYKVVNKEEIEKAISRDEELIEKSVRDYRIFMQNINKGKEPSTIAYELYLEDSKEIENLKETLKYINIRKQKALDAERELENGLSWTEINAETVQVKELKRYITAYKTWNKKPWKNTNVPLTLVIIDPEKLDEQMYIDESPDDFTTEHVNPYSHGYYDRSGLFIPYQKT